MCIVALYLLFRMKQSVFFVLMFMGSLVALLATYCRGNVGYGIAGKDW